MSKKRNIVVNHTVDNPLLTPQGNRSRSLKAKAARLLKRVELNPRSYQHSSTEYEIVGPKNARWSIKSRLMCAADFETDPFGKSGEKRIVKPFAIGIYDAHEYVSYWGDDVAEWFVSWLKKRPPCIIYFHNGGNFDFWFLRPYWRGDPRIINGRIVQVQIGDHVLQDSYKLLPVPLAELGGKKEISYDLMERGQREKHRPEILSYMKQDCKTLYENVRLFFDEFGVSLTIGTAAIRELERFHDFDRLTPAMDGFLRPYFFGGRNQCFESGVLEGKWKIYDVNSMYPYVMRSFKHPVSDYFLDDKIRPGKTAFIHCRASNWGCLPTRNALGDLDFSVESGEYFLSIHEYVAGVETGTLKTHETIRTINFPRWTVFDKFVDMYYAKRLMAKKISDTAKTTFYKLLLNNSFGKFAQNPASFFDYKITNQLLPRCKTPMDCPKPCGDCWEPHAFIDDEFVLWAKPVKPASWSYFNVGTGASITGAARSYLLRGLAAAKRPVYCDTDSIICESLNMPLDEKELGAWKLEAEGTRLAIAGKKTYALVNPITKKLYDDIKQEQKERGKLAKRKAEIVDGEFVQVVKMACKGGVGDITAQEIFNIARGDLVEKESNVPKFQLSGKVIFVTRRFKATAKLKRQGARIGKGK